MKGPSLYGYALVVVRQREEDGGKFLMVQVREGGREEGRVDEREWPGLHGYAMVVLRQREKENLKLSSLTPPSLPPSPPSFLEIWGVRLVAPRRAYRSCLYGYAIVVLRQREKENLKLSSLTPPSLPPSPHSFLGI